jgi:predicted kinase
MRTYSRSRAWSDAQFDAAVERMTARGLFGDDEVTQAGLDAREAVEVATDRQEASIIDAIGDDFDELCELLEPWADEIREQKGYPTSAGQIVGRRS